MAAPSMPWSCIASTDARRAGVCPRRWSTSASAIPGAWLKGEVPLAAAALAMKRGKVAIEAPASKEVGSAVPGKGAPSFVDAAASVTGPAGATAVSSEIVTTSSPLAFLPPSAGTMTSSAFLLREGSSSLMTGGTLATVGWPILFTPVLYINHVSNIIRAAIQDKGRRVYSLGDWNEA